MFYGNNPQETRAFFFNAWQKHCNNLDATPLEQQIIQVILDHPEYHKILEAPQAAHQQYFPEQGQSNPFLHMGLHIALKEQISTDRPAGITALYKKLLHKHEAHEVEHKMMDCLAEAIWAAQRAQRMPDEKAYLRQLKKLS